LPQRRHDLRFGKLALLHALLLPLEGCQASTPFSFSLVQFCGRTSVFPPSGGITLADLVEMARFHEVNEADGFINRLKRIEVARYESRGVALAETHHIFISVATSAMAENARDELYLIEFLIRSTTRKGLIRMRIYSKVTRCRKTAEFTDQLNVLFNEFSFAVRNLKAVRK
jgi:hypothetical protein